MHTPYTSSHLYHLVGSKTPMDDEANWATLCLVLDAKCISYWPHDPQCRATVAYTVHLEEPLESGKLVVPEMTCFADIPEDSLGVHVGKYGRFGVSFDRRFLSRYGARPVTYVPMASDDYLGIAGKTLLRDIEAIYRGFRDHQQQVGANQGARRTRTLGQVPQGEHDVLRAVKGVLEKDFLAFIKPFNVELPPNDPHNFYMEREWRLMGNLKFQHTDIMQVCVAAGYAGKLRSRYPQVFHNVKELAI